MRDWSASLSGITGLIRPEQEMANYFPVELERGRTSRPPYTPYVKTDALASFPWMPPGDPHQKALGRWEASQATFRRNTGERDLSRGQYALYRMRYILAGDLASAWSECGGLTAQINNLAGVLNTVTFETGFFSETSPAPRLCSSWRASGISIEGDTGVSITYGYRIHQHIRKSAHRRSASTDYFEIPSAIRPDIRAAATRDIEASEEATRKAKEKEKANKEKGKGGPKWRDRAPGKGAVGREADPAPDKDTGRNGRRWAK